MKKRQWHTNVWSFAGEFRAGDGVWEGRRRCEDVWGRSTVVNALKDDRLTSLLPIASRTVPETSSTAPIATSTRGGKTVFVTEVVSLSSTL
jgi:hypothetical protein